MAIKLDDEYTIVPDNANWTLFWLEKGKINRKTGKQIKTPQRTYHATLRQALAAYCDKVLKPKTSITELLSKIDELNAKIDSLEFKK